ncbi:MAG: alpha/beta hydrolase-fold protein [Bryobacteraceae bacterium]
MSYFRVTRFVLAAASCFALLALDAPAPQHLFVRVTLGSAFTHPLSGRLLLFVERGNGAKEIDTDPFHPAAVSVSAKEVHDLSPGSSVDIDTDDIAYPAPLSQLPPGVYQAQAVLDIDRSYNYGGRAPGDPISSVTALPNFPSSSGKEPIITLSSTVPEQKLPEPKLPAEELRQAKSSIQSEDFVSPVLSNFWGRPIHMRALVVEPPEYASGAVHSFPAVYFTHGFGGKLEYLRLNADHIYARMAEKKMPAMIWIMLDESSPTGTHEFADSANNGPWGHALTTEFIPYLEGKYRLDPRPQARFLNGHSSGGWATLWLQVAYPKAFAGTWSTSPDPTDFHDFTGPDLYAPHANVYRKPDGSLYPLVRMNGKVVATFEDFARLESVLGPYGGQLASFEWVFSPRGPDGRPMQMFDRATGDVDPQVIEAWKKYDIARLIESNWSRLAPDLNGKIHVIVGTADTFYLDGAAHKLKAVLDSLHAQAQLTFLEGRTHMDLYKVGNDPQGMFDQIANEMYQSYMSHPGPRAERDPSVHVQ